MEDVNCPEQLAGSKKPVQGTMLLLWCRGMETQRRSELQGSAARWATINRVHPVTLKAANAQSVAAERLLLPALLFPVACCLCAAGCGIAPQCCRLCGGLQVYGRQREATHEQHWLIKQQRP